MLKKMQYKMGWLGFHQEGLSALKGILEAGYSIEAVITLDDECASLRSGNINYDLLCDDYGVQLYKIKNINDLDSLSILKNLDLDILFVIGWSQIVKKEAMACVKIGLIGAHASLLPHNKGSAPVNWAIIKGEEVTGNTLIWLKEGVDNGDIIDQRKFDITLYDSCKTIYEKVAVSNKEMILDFLENCEDDIPVPVRQEQIEEPVLPRRRPQDGLVNWNQSSRKVYDFIRALTKPYPGAFSYINGKKMLIWETAFIREMSEINNNVGQIVGTVYSPNEKACGLMVACQQGNIIVLHMEDEAGNNYQGQSLISLYHEGLEFHDE